MSLLTALIVKNSHILAVIYFINLKQYPRPNWKGLIPNLDLREIIGKVVITLALFRKLVALVLGKNCVKGLRVTKIVKQIKFEEDWGELQVRNCLLRQSFTKYLKQTLVFM